MLDHLLRKCPLTPREVFSEGGELKGSRSGLGKTLQRHSIPPKFLKEVTTRQAHPDARALMEMLEYGSPLARMDETTRTKHIQKGITLIAQEARKWLNRQPLRISCDRQQSPGQWVVSILEKAKGRSGGVVEQHLVGAKLQKRHPHIAIPNHPGHAGDAQTGRSGDFSLSSVSYHVTATDGKEAVERCRQNVKSGVFPVLLVPKRHIVKATTYAEIAGIEGRLSILSLEDFITQNIIEMSTQQQQDFFSTLRSIIEEYNKRLEEVETDMSLKIELS